MNLAFKRMHVMAYAICDIFVGIFIQTNFATKYVETD